MIRRQRKPLAKVPLVGPDRAVRTRPLARRGRLLSARSRQDCKWRTSNLILVKLHPPPSPWSSSKDLFLRPVCARATAYLGAQWIMKPTRIGAGTWDRLQKLPIPAF